MNKKVVSILKSIAYCIINLIAQYFAAIVFSIIISVNNIDIVSLGIPSDYEKEFIEIIIRALNIILTIASIFAILVLFVIYKIKKKKVKKELMFYKTNKSNILISLGLGLSCLLLNTGVMDLIYLTGFLKESFDYRMILLEPMLQGTIFMIIFSVGIIGPIAKEYLFRGVIFNTLKKEFSMKWAIIIQGVFFGIYHFNLIQGVYATLLGILFGYITYKTKSIYPAIIIHMVTNTLSILMIYYLGDILSNIGVYIGFIVVGLIATVILIKLIKKKNLNNDEELESVV